MREEGLVIVGSFTDELDVAEEQFELDRNIDFSEEIFGMNENRMRGFLLYSFGVR